MSRINRIRIVNLNYNQNAIRIDDELFDLGREHTLFSLRNGGGKSVLVQMISSLFVRKRYRDTSERPFASYFSSNQPSFIMVEWALDHEAGYVLTGMMVRENQEIKEDEKADELEIISFIHEYEGENKFDIQHLPIITQEGLKKKLNGFHVCKKLFEDCKQNKALKFDYFDLNQGVRSRSYFSKLEEYQIFSKEWESIIKKVNLKESGLSELFKEAKDEKGLTEKWFLDAIENKLNKEQNRMKEFEKLLNKYVLQYKENEGNFKRSAGILTFEELITPLVEQEHQLAKKDDDRVAFEQKIATLTQVLDFLISEYQAKQEQIESDIFSVKEKRHQIHHEEFSLAIYELESENEKLELEKQQVIKLQTQYQTQYEAYKKQKYCYEAANRYQTYKKASEDVQRYEVELQIAKQSNEELLPRQNDIGYSLRLMYEDLVDAQELKHQDNQMQVLDNEQNKNITSNKLESKRSDLLLYSTERATCQTLIKQFDKQEQTLTEKYHESFLRNLEGYYEPLFLQTKQQAILDKLEQLKKLRKDNLTKQNQLDETIHAVSRSLETINQQLGVAKTKVDQYQNELDELTKELEIRKSLLTYIAFNENQVFEYERIIEAFEDKKQQVMERLKKLQRRMDQLSDEYEKLKAGAILELPKEVEEALKDEGIHYVLGMEWLKRNDRTIAQNQELVTSHPFIPYSLLISRSEFLKLTQAKLDVFTAFPIPILIREQLDQDLKLKREMGITSLENIHFYVLFNDELLDETRLEQLLLIKNNEMETLANQIQIQQQYLDTYQDKISLVKHQRLSKQTYDNCQAELKAQLTAQTMADEKMISLNKEKEEAVKNQSNLVSDLSNLETKFVVQEQKLQDLKTFSQDYEAYLEQLNKCREYQDAIDCSKDEIDDLEETFSRLNREYDLLKDQQRDLKTKLEQTKSDLIKFSHYEKGIELNKDIEDLLAEYQAITNKMSDSIKRREQDLEDAKKRFETEEKNLDTLIKRYQLIDADYQSLLYDEFAEEKVISKIDETNAVIDNQKNIISGLNQTISINDVQKANKQKEMNSTIQETEILPKHLVMKRDFNTLLAHLTQEEEVIQQQLKMINDCLSVCEREHSVLMQYEHFKIEPLEQVEKKYYHYSETNWREERQLLLRDYNTLTNEIRTLKDEITDEINQLGHDPLFEDEFFKQPLNRIEHVKHNAIACVEQYQIIHKVFESIVKKLEVDIAYSEKEKANVVGLLLDYVAEVHKNLGMIDQNSSIHIRGKNIKMLRIKLPNWEENQSVYEVRMNGFVDKVTTNCLELLNKNQNIEEFIGHQVTTKHLYDRIVGTSNVEIKLYKIEEQREYQISWEQVAKNSGGEGFLSAFVILSSLLSFMRREETDLFLSHEQGKVLIMDNPFAQTNAAHLLKPLFELAKKNNTQLICLSGLGGESIYSRFENIYSLSLVPSSFKKGYGYLKSNHIKGQTEQQLMIPSRIYVEEAHQEVLF